MPGREDPATREVPSDDDDLSASLSKSAKLLRNLIQRAQGEDEDGAESLPVSTPDGEPADQVEVLPPDRVRRGSGSGGAGDPSAAAADLPNITTENPVLGTMLKLVDGIKGGEKLTELTKEVTQYVANQEARSELLSNLALTHDFERSVKYAIVRDKLESYLLSLAANDRLTPSQSIMFLKIVQEEADNIAARVRAGANPVNDVVALLNRADFATQMEDEELQKKFAGTTPQGREIVRRLAYKLAKATKEKRKK